LDNLLRTRYIWRLLENPNKKFSHIDLQTIVSGEQSEPDENYKKMSSEQIQEEGFTDNLEDIMVDKISDNEKEDFQKLIYKCWNNRIQKKPNSKEDWESVKKHLFNEYGIKIRFKKEGPKFKLHKRLKPDAEKARTSVTKNIRNALKDIEEKMPTLYEHLKNRIKTDKTCRYEIESSESTQWHIEWNK